MSDGVRLALTTYLPDAPGDGPFPAIVESLPYRKDDDCTARDFSTYAYLAQRGFAGVRIDVRGTGASTGIIGDEYLAIEQSDNLEVMDWLAQQDWCTGNLGMWGISWGGFSALQTAMLRPPQLKAIVAMHATHDRFACDVHYTGGSLHAAEQVDWPPSMISTNALPPDPDIFGEGWKEEWLKRLEGTPQWPLEWMTHQYRDDYWKHGSPASDYSAIQCPTLLVGGWLDGYVDGILAMAANLECPTRTIVGPWGHYRPATGEPGPTLDHFDLMARWFGHHLRGDQNAVMDMAPFTSFIRTEPPYDEGVVTGFWRTEAQWPPLRSSDQMLSLSELDGQATTWDGPQWVGAHAPAWDRSGIASTDSSRDDLNALTFTTSPLRESLEILGTPEAELAVSTDRPYGLVAVRLLAIDPDGRSELICRGSRNLSFPEDLSSPVTPHPGSPMTIRFPLLATSAVVPAGWQIRVAVSGADFPVVWPPPGRFTLKIDPGASLIHLPTIEDDGEDGTVEIPISPPPLDPPVESLDSSSNWSIESNPGRTTFHRTVVNREFQPDRDRLTYGSVQRWAVSVDDDEPGTTTVQSESNLTLSRPGWNVAVSSKIAINGDEKLHVAIQLSTTLDGEPFWERSWDEEIPRVWA